MAQQNQAAQQPAAQTQDQPKAANGLSKMQATRKVVTPTMDVDSMDEAQVKETLKRLLAQRATQRDSTKTIRFNDGSESTLEWLDEAKTKPKIDPATKRQVGSARDSGTISIYGFGRNPISLYPNQWLDLLTFGQDIVEFIAGSVDHINEYIRTRQQGRTDRDVNEDMVLQLQELYHKAQFGDDNEVVGGEEVGTLAGAKADDYEEGIVHSAIVEDDEGGGEDEAVGAAT